MQTNAQLSLRPEAIFEAVERELGIGRAVWEGQRLLDKRESQDGYLDELLEDRANHVLEHVFSLLSLVLPREPVKLAFRALHTDDKLMRALALEYLESVAPEGVRTKLSALAEGAPFRGDRSAADLADQLLRSRDSIALKIRTTTSGVPSPGGPQSTATTL